MAITDFLDKTATIIARAPVRGGFCDDTPAMTPVVGQGAVPCMVRPLRVEAVTRQGRDASQGWHRVYFDKDPGLTNDQVLAIAGGPRLKVAGQVNYNSMDMLFAVDCTEMRT